MEHIDEQEIDPPMPHRGQTIGAYTLREPAGKGGFKQVWKAERHGIVPVPVALGIFKPETLNVDNAIREARNWTSVIGHINVLSIQEFQVDNGLYYIVSEWIGGGTLQNWLKSSQSDRLNLLTIARMMCGILSGLDHLHEAGIIHRDLKLTNVMVKGETPLITDFGQSRPDDYDMTEDLGGSPRYMAPEAFEGRFSRQTDIWSCGVIFYRMLTRQFPFDGKDHLMVADAVRYKEPEQPPLFQILPLEIRRIILRALSKDSNQRYATAREMRADIEKAVAPPEGILTFMFIDIVKSVNIKDRMPGASATDRDHAYFSSIFNPFAERLGASVQDHHGTVIKGTGDGFFVVFPNPDHAVQCAIELQQNLVEHPIGTNPGQLQVRIGLNTGHAVVKDVAGIVDYTGLAVDLAARIANHDEVKGGEIALSPESFALIKMKNVQFEDRLVKVMDMGEKTLHVVQFQSGIIINEKDGQRMILIPGGEYQKGARNSLTHVDVFYIGETPVTVGQYKKFCEAESRSLPVWPNHNQNWQYDDYPMVQVTWQDAFDYCRWAGGSLPTSEQWEKAARGTEGRKFPWGDTWRHEFCNVSSQSPGDLGLPAQPVGSYPTGKSPFGLLDALGTVFEWCADRTTNERFAARIGCSWKSTATQTNAWYNIDQTSRSAILEDTGFRMLRATVSTSNSATVGNSNLSSPDILMPSERTTQAT